MLWSELSSGAFAEAVGRAGGLCLVPMGCLERHGPHLPVGTDQITADAVARAAAEREPAVVFPSYYFGKIFTARHLGGTVALTRKLLLPLLAATVKEIARNGFGRILIVNGHGGNTTMLHFFLRSLLEEPHDYVVYATNYYEMEEGPRRKWHQIRGSDFGGHADEMETSVMRHLRPELVHMEALSDPEDGRSRDRTAHLPDLDTSISWYADHPTHYQGDARSATAEKGEFMFNACVDKVVRQMRAVKADDVSPALQNEFYGRARRPRHEA
ncbi:MAG: creatininase family protein [Planctomycetota bacterium]|jgi:creatinine amidohydrolase